MKTVCAWSCGLLLALPAGCRGAAVPPPRPAEVATIEVGTASVPSAAPEALPESAPEAVPGERAQALRRFVEGLPPEYPKVSRRLGEEGTVEVSIEIDADGTLHEVVLVTSSGFARLDAAALAAVRRWVFAPVTGTHEREVVQHRIRFRLDGR